MDFTLNYIEFIKECDRHMHRQQYKEAFLVLSKIKFVIEQEEDTDFDNDFNSRAALCALLYGQCEEALRLTEMVNLQTPGFLLIQSLRGWALKEIGYEKRANVLFNYVLNAVPDTDSVMDSLGAAISSKLLGNELSHFFFDFTIGKFDLLNGNDKQLNLLWAIFAYIKKSELESTPEEKQASLLKGLSLTKDSAVLYDHLGHTYYSQKNYEVALKCYLKSIEIYPNNNFYRHIKVSFIYFYTGREDKAKDFILHFLAQSRDLHIFYWIICPSIELKKSKKLTDFEKNYKIGLLLYYSQVYQSSYIMLQKAKEYDRYNYKLCIFMCIVQKYLGLLNEAIENLEDLRTNKYSDDIPLMIILAELYTVTQSHDKAEELYLKIIQNTPNKSFPLYIYVKFLNKMNRLDDSLIFIQKAIDIDPKKIKLLIMKALIHSSLKQLNKAYETYEEVLKINPNLQSTKYQLSQINFVLNNYQKSFDQMMSIQEGEVGYEKSLSLMVKLFISYPQELTKEQLEFANTKLREKISHHLQTLGDPPKKKKKIIKKPTNKMSNVDSNLKDNSKIRAEVIEEEKVNNKSKQKKETSASKKKKIKQLKKKKYADEEDDEEEEEEEEEQEKENGIDEVMEQEEQHEEEIKLEKEEKKENNEQNQEQAEESGNDEQGNQEEIEINKLLEGQAESLDELDEIDQEINQSLSSKSQDSYKEYLQKIKEENIKDKQEIFLDYFKYFNENQLVYNRLHNQSKKAHISTLFEDNDIDEILFKNQPEPENNGDNNEMLSEENQSKSANSVRENEREEEEEEKQSGGDIQNEHEDKEEEYLNEEEESEVYIWRMTTNRISYGVKAPKKKAKKSRSSSKDNKQAKKIKKAVDSVQKEDDDSFNEDSFKEVESEIEKSDEECIEEKQKKQKKTNKNSKIVLTPQKKPSRSSTNSSEKKEIKKVSKVKKTISKPKTKSTSKTNEGLKKLKNKKKLKKNIEKDVIEDEEQPKRSKSQITSSPSLKRKGKKQTKIISQSSSKKNKLNSSNKKKNSVQEEEVNISEPKSDVKSTRSKSSVAPSPAKQKQPNSEEKKTPIKRKQTQIKSKKRTPQEGSKKQTTNKKQSITIKKEPWQRKVVVMETKLLCKGIKKKDKNVNSKASKTKKNQTTKQKKK